MPRPAPVTMATLPCSRTEGCSHPPWRASTRALTRKCPSGPAATGQAVAMEHKDTATLEAGLARVREAPADNGIVELIVRRPAVDERVLMDEATLDAEV